jgi:hypothetical protein
MSSAGSPAFGRAVPGPKKPFGPGSALITSRNTLLPAIGGCYARAIGLVGAVTRRLGAKFRRWKKKENRDKDASAAETHITTSTHGARDAQPA